MLWEAMGRVGLERPSFNHVLLHRSLFMRWYQEVGPQATSPLGQYINFFPPLPSPPLTQPAVLYNIAGYLLCWEGGRGELVQALGQVVRVWCDRSAMQHTPLNQHLYISEALVLFATCAAERSGGQLKQTGVSTVLHWPHTFPHQCACVWGGRAESAKQPRQGTWVGSDIAVQVLASAPPSSAAPPTGGSGGPP